MKKSIALVAMAFGVTSAFAQDLTSKKGEPFLPEAGDYMIGVDANPFLNYVGNFFGKAGAASGVGSNQAPTWNYLNANSNIITGKYFKDATTAYRVGIRLGYDSKTTKKYLSDVTETGIVYPALPSQKEDKMAHKSSTIGLTVGIEKRKGKTRLQGFYGAELMVWGSSKKDKYTYGQSVDGTTAGLQNVTALNTSDFSGVANVLGANVNSSIGVAGETSSRVTSRKVGGGFGAGVRAFIGAEYFVAPKISIGGEFGWGIGYMTGGKTVTTVESIGGTSPAKSDVTKTEKNGGHFVIDTDANNSTTGSILAPSASLRLNLHF